MATIIAATIKVDELKKIDQSKIINGEKGNLIPVTIKVNDESRYGNNVEIIIQQTSEEREAKANRHWIGNGSVVWTDGTVVKGQKDNAQQTQQPKSVKNDDLDFPFN